MLRCHLSSLLASSPPGARITLPQSERTFSCLPSTQKVIQMIKKEIVPKLYFFTKMTENTGKIWSSEFHFMCDTEAQRTNLVCQAYLVGW